MPFLNDDREFKESPWTHGRNETRPFTFDWTGLGDSVTGPVSSLYDMTGGDENDPSTWSNVSATKLTGSDSVSGDFVVTKSVTGLDPNRRYWFGVLLNVDGRAEEYYGIIHGKP